VLFTAAQAQNEPSMRSFGCEIDSDMV